MLSFKSYVLLALTLSLSPISCSNQDKDPVEELSVEKIEKITKQEKIIYTSCGNDDISKYLDDGWKVINKETLEVPCSWKTKLSTPGCDPKYDKACLIRIPDKKGVQTKYILEK